MTADVAALLGEAARHLNGGDVAMAGRFYMTALNAAPGEPQAWLGLGLTAALRRDHALVLQLAERRGQLFRDGFAWFHDLLTTLMSYRVHQAVLELGGVLDAASPYLPSQLYYAGCIHLLAGREDEAFECFNRLKPLLEQRRGSLPIGAEDRFNIAYRQASLVEDGDYPDRLDPAALAEAERRLPAMEPVGEWRPASAAEYTLLAACDGRYLERFAADFLRSAETHGGGASVHLHVVEPTEAGLAAVAEQAAGSSLTVNLTREGACDLRSGAYYACSRFLVADKVMARDDRPVMITDIDIVLARPLAEVAAAARRFDFASFVHDGFGPCSRLPAVLTWFQDGACGRDALAAVRKTILSKLSVPWPHNWMLDQAALMTARRWLRLSRPAARIGQLNDELGHPFAHFIECRGDDDEKQALIRAAAGR